MPKPVTDPALLTILDQGGDLRPVNDPELLKQLNGGMGVTERGADILKSGGVGLGEGGISVAGLPGDVQALVQKGADYFGDREALSRNLINQGKATRRAADLPRMPTSGEIKSKIEESTGPFYTPKTREGEYARTIGQFVPNAVMGPGGAIRRTAQVLAPAVVSETAGQISKGQPAEPYMRAGGAVAGTLTPSMLARTITPLPANPVRQGMVDTLAQEGVVPTAGQRTGSKSLQYMESSLGDLPGAGGGATAATTRAGEQFTRAALRRVGSNADRALPEVVDEAFTRIGGQFDALAGRNTLTADRQLATDLTNDITDYYNLVAPPNQAPVIRNYLDEIRTQVQRNGGQLPGEAYQSLRSRMERAARGAQGQPEVARTIRDMRESLDDAMERSIAVGGNQADLGAWREARTQYRNLLAIERTATAGGENAAEGLISPAQLRMAAVGQGRRAYARGQGDFAELARAGNAVMAPLPQSGTAPRAAAVGLPAMLGTGLGYLLGGGEGATYGGMAGATAAATAPSALGRTLMSPIVQRYLGNQLIPGRDDRLGARALAQLLMSEPRNQLLLESPR